MAKCPNCDRETMRTQDWACQWCGYPLMSKAFRKIDKTYRELQAERLREAGEEPPEPIAEARPVPPPPPPPPRPAVPETPKPAPPPPPQPTRVPEPKPEPDRPVAPPVREPEVRTKAPESAPPATSPVIILGPSPQPQALPKPEVRTEVKESAPPIAASEATTPPPQAEAPPEPEVARAEPEPELPPGVIRMTVSDLNQLFRADRSAANTQLSDKTLRVVGVLEKVVYREVLDTAYIMLISPEKGEWNVRCVFDKKFGPQLMRLGEKNTVIVQGAYAGCERNIILKDCVLV